MSDPIKVRGAEEVVGGFDAVDRAAKDMTEPHRAMLSRLVPEVASRTPRRTGDLAASWDGRVTASAATIASPLAYSLPVEVGTIHMAGAHMVSDTLASGTDEIVRTYEDAVADAARRAGFRVTR
jgi:hypothetical protein